MAVLRGRLRRGERLYDESDCKQLTPLAPTEERSDYWHKTDRQPRVCRTEVLALMQWDRDRHV